MRDLLCTSCRRLNVLKMRSPCGSVAWDGMEWELCLGVRPPCSGAIHSQACVCGACCCWPMLAAAGLSFLSESRADGCSLPTLDRLWSKISCMASSAAARMDLCSLKLSFMCGRQGDRLLQWDPSQSQSPLKVCILTLTCWCRPSSFGLHECAEQLEYCF